MKGFLNDKAPGFYVTAGAAVFSLITGIIYAGLWGGTEYMAWGAFAFVLVGMLLAAAVLLVPAFVRFPFGKLVTKAAPWILLGCGIFGLAFFIDAAYGYITRAAIGMDLTSLGAFSFGMPLFFAALFFLLNCAAATAAIFIKIFKKETGAEQTGGNGSPSPAEPQSKAEEAAPSEEKAETVKEVTEGEVL